MAVLVFPYYDFDSRLEKHLVKLTPVLKQYFDKAFVSLTPYSVKNNASGVEFMSRDSFFEINSNPENSLAGDHFVSVFKNAINKTSEDKILHLCTLDRLVFALTNFADKFIKDVTNIRDKDLPLEFLRSDYAWSTHPVNYFAIESVLTELGKKLFEKELDFAWCHIVLTTKQLTKIIEKLTAHDLVVFAQVIYELKNELMIKKVDWLAWEDPFVFDLDAKTLKTERENDPNESKKRFGYVIPMIQYLSKTTTIQ